MDVDLSESMLSCTGKASTPRRAVFPFKNTGPREAEKSPSEGLLPNTCRVSEVW
jgi:hypothetical protein